jgi:hypothetical protein
MQEYHKAQEIAELYRLLNELMADESLDSLKRIYKQFYEWCQGLIYWDADLLVC